MPEKGNKLSKNTDFQSYYKARLVSADEASKLVKSGDNVVFSAGREAQAIGLALAARKEELRGVKVHVPSPAMDFGWYDPGWEESFSLSMAFMPTSMARQAIAERRGDWVFGSPSVMEDIDAQKIDVYLVEVSPPDEHGYCSFGASRWDKKEKLRWARIVLAEVNPRLIRTYGDNFVHASEIDYFVENPNPTYHRPDVSDVEPPKVAKTVAGYVSSLVNDGDTIQIGTGTVTEWIPRLDAFDNKHELGVHTEIIARGLVRLVKEGVITGSRKSLHPGKLISCAGGGTWEDMQFMHLNPQFELHSVYYVNNPLIVAKNDNMVAINQAIAVDLSGQITAQSIGPTIWTGEGGQPFLAIGALLSKGGRSITVIPSTARGGEVSRIVPRLEAGTIITLPPAFADIVVSEYGIAKLRGKSRRERAQQLIAIAHPDFRAELRKQARKLYWP